MVQGQLTPDTRTAVRFSVAPMLDWTDRHCRVFHRLLSRRARLYTEMVTTGALLHGDVARHLDFDASEHPVALQLGGADPQALAQAAILGERHGYDEINLNCGCPSDRVQEGRFGACLMADPALVAAGVAAMQSAVRIPVTVKCRIGIDDCDDLPFLMRFVDTVAAAGCDTFIVHARKAWLQGLSPKENREIPPLTYAHVWSLKQRRPDLTIVINGGIRSLDEVQAQLAHVDGVMVGREAYENPWFLASVDAEVFGDAQTAMTRESVLEAYAGYVEQRLAAGTPMGALIRPILGLYRGQPGGRAFRRVLSENAHRPGVDVGLLARAVEQTRGRESRVERPAA